MTPQERRDWALFADWCESVDEEPLPASASLIGDFLSAFPAAPSAQGRRVRAIRRSHEASGLTLDLPVAAQESPFRVGPDWANVSRALEQLPVQRHRKYFPLALRGRRDGWLIVLTGCLGMSRRQARAITEEHVSLYPHLAVHGGAVETTSSPKVCPACAVTRWLRVAGAASFGWTSEVKEIVAPDEASEGVHDCRVGLDGSWRQAQTLLPHIDRYGWVSAEPMSTRAISAVLASRQIPAAVEAAPSHGVASAATGRFASATRDELADAYDDVDARAAEMLLRLRSLVDEGDQTLDRIRSFAR